MKRLVGKRLDGSQHVLKGHKVIQVTKLPLCNFDHKAPTDAEYDFKTVLGPWANACEQHFHQYSPNSQLGLGVGQMLIRSDTVEEQMQVAGSGEWVTTKPVE